MEKNQRLFLQKNEKYFDVTVDITLKWCYDTDIDVTDTITTKTRRNYHAESS